MLLKARCNRALGLDKSATTWQRHASSAPCLPRPVAQHGRDTRRPSPSPLPASVLSSSRRSDWRVRHVMCLAEGQTVEGQAEAQPQGVELAPHTNPGVREVVYDEEAKVVRVPLFMLEGDGMKTKKMVLFTCNKCDKRTARLVSIVAWERGAVFAQCQNCKVWHTLRAHRSIVDEIRYSKDGQQTRLADVYHNDSQESPQPGQRRRAAADAQLQHAQQGEGEDGAHIDVRDESR